MANTLKSLKCFLAAAAANRTQLAAARREETEHYRRAHPVLSGAVPVVPYIPPAGRYLKPARTYAH